MQHSEDIGQYEGLCIKSASIFAASIGMEREDLQQELRLKVLQATRSYDPTRSKMSERAYVFSCITNRLKDAKRDYWRRRNGPLEEVHSEDANPEPFFGIVTHDQTFGVIDEGNFTMPATVTAAEESVIFLLVLGYTQTEIAPLLGVDYGFVVKLMRELRAKLADWRPVVSPLVPVVVVVA